MTPSPPPVVWNAVTVGPDEVLVVTIPDTEFVDGYDWASDLVASLEQIGLAGRSLVIQGDAEMAVVKRDAAPSPLNEENTP
jgi:hypothetical protein